MTAAGPADPAQPAEPADPATPSRSGASPIAWVVALGLAAMVGTLLFVGGYLAAGGASGSCVAPTEAFAPFCDAYAKLKAQYMSVIGNSPAEFRAVLRQEHDRWAPIIAAGGIKAE